MVGLKRLAGWFSEGFREGFEGSEGSERSVGFRVGCLLVGEVLHRFERGWLSEGSGGIIREGFRRGLRRGFGSRLDSLLVRGVLCEGFSDWFNVGSGGHSRGGL